MQKKFYPSKRQSNTKWGEIETQKNTIDLNAPFRFNDEKCNAIYNDFITKFSDEWFNNTGNINAGNSLMQESFFINQRLNYAECASLACDSIINNAINKYKNELLRSGGNIVIEHEQSSEIIKQLETRLKEIRFFETLSEAISTSLIFGGALIYIDINTQSETSLREPLYLKQEIFTKNKINSFKIVPPYLCGASEVNTSNPLRGDFMRPNLWYVSGSNETIHASRVLSLSFFETPSLFKPLYNYFGISLCQFMKNYVMSADIARQSLSDLFLRFRTEIIQTDLIKINPSEAKARGAYINRAKNNNGILFLTKDENYIQSITTLTGLDKLIAQMQENIAVSARMPSVKLLGLTPSGFNATGEFDLNSYYDEIMSLQNSILKPLIERVLKMLCLELQLDINPSYEFNILEKETKLNKAQVKNLEADFVGKNITNGVITQEQGFNYLKENDLINAADEFNEQEAENDFDNLLNESLNNGESKE